MKQTRSPPSQHSEKDSRGVSEPEHASCWVVAQPWGAAGLGRGCEMAEAVVRQLLSETRGKRRCEPWEMEVLAGSAVCFLVYLPDASCFVGASTELGSSLGLS